MLLHPELKTGKFLQSRRQVEKKKCEWLETERKKDYKADLGNGLRSLRISILLDSQVLKFN